MPLDPNNLFLVVALGFLIVMMFLSSRKRKRQAAELQSSLKVGAGVMLTSGIYGVVEKIDGDKITIVSSGSTKLQVNKGAVARIEEVAKPAVAKAEPKSAAKKPVAKKPAAKKPAAKKPAAK